MKKMGHIHIPKCAGSSLNKMLYKQFELSPKHFTGVVYQKQTDRTLDVVIDSPDFVELSNRQFVSGHVSFKEMALLQRNFIFTVLRNPYERFFSLFTYNITRALKSSNIPNLQGYENKTFIEHLAFLSTRKINTTYSQLIADYPDPISKLLIDRVFFRDNELLCRTTINKALSRLDVIYYCDMSLLLSHLTQLSLVPALKPIIENVSSIPINIKMGCNQATFKKLIDENCWLEVEILKQAHQLYPETIIKPCIDFDDFLNGIKDRFSLLFD